MLIADLDYLESILYISIGNFMKRHYIQYIIGE